MRERMRDFAAKRRRYNYRRLHWLLGHEGHYMNHNKFRRLYREEWLQMRHRKGRNRTLGTRRWLEIPQGINQRWSLGFVSDALSYGRRPM